MVDFGIGEIIGIVTAVSAVAGATTGIVSGVQAHKQAQIQAQQQDLQIQAEKTQAAVDAQAQQRRLAQVLASQDAIFGGSNVSMSSGTPSVIAGDTYNQAAIQSGQAQLFSNTRVGILGLQRQDTLLAGNYGLATGLLKGGTSLINAAGDLAKAGLIPHGGVKTDPFDSGDTSGGDSYTGDIA